MVHDSLQLTGAEHPPRGRETSDTPATPDHLTQTDLLPDLLAAVSSSSHVARSKAPAATEPPKHGHPDVGPSTYGVSQEIPRNAAAKTPLWRPEGEAAVMSRVALAERTRDAQSRMLAAQTAYFYQWVPANAVHGAGPVIAPSPFPAIPQPPTRQLHALSKRFPHLVPRQGLTTQASPLEWSGSPSNPSVQHIPMPMLMQR